MQHKLSLGYESLMTCTYCCSLSSMVANIIDVEHNPNVIKFICLVLQYSGTVKRHYVCKRHVAIDTGATY